MDRLQKVMDFCIRHQTALGYSTVSLLTAVSEQIFSSAVFKCPCNSGNMLYGSSFLLAPAVFLFLLGFMVNPKRWRLLTGKCSPENDPQCSPWGTCVCFWQLWVPMMVRASVAPVTWIAVALLGANYYECTASGSSLIERYYCKDNGTECRNQLLKMPCDEELSANFSREHLSLHAQSQVTGWFLMASIMTVALILKCVSRCRSRLSYLQRKFQKIYLKKEQELFKENAKDNATKLAKRNINCFFEDAHPAPFYTPSNEDWQKISLLYTFNSQEQYYSMLHNYVSTKKGNSTKFKEEGQEPTESANGNSAQTSI